MPANGFTVGKDIALTIVTSTGILALPVTTTSFDSKPQYNKVRGVCLDGVNRGFNAPTGWDLAFQLDRSSSVVDDFFAQQEAGYFAGLDTLTGSVTETITEANGAVTQYRYTGVILALDDAGKFTGDAKVGQTISAFASRKLKVA
ncbi:MAG: hypothetical protein GAK28_04916 [Luteibacter sp.]|uniref:hypothetical protein n=1 Tax=Luteibacter sp. TaxID=1886636 RepID=UPI00138284A3|nr:hypothetical protein [Luteibacter sp.]KAF1003115.1 MAG: hypothetical protein GAK28_04916 [Luteibacter sp.]